MIVSACGFGACSKGSLMFSPIERPSWLRAPRFAALLRREVNARRVDFEVLCSLPSIYLLTSIIWAVSYQIIETASPGSFQGGADVPSFSEFLYFSLVTSTTLGYGDITPVGPVTRMWVALEAVAGVFFMALLVSRLVTLYRG